MTNINCKVVLISAALVFLLGACESTLTRENYIKWVRDYDNELHVKSQVSNFVFDLQYQPAEFVLLQRGIMNMSDVERETEMKNLSGLQYYTLTISTADKMDLVNYGVSNTAEQQQKQYYLSYQLQNDITVEEDGKVLPCVLYHFERPTDQHGGRTIVLGFENQNKKSEEAIVVIRSELFSSLPIKIKVAKSNIPQVAL